MDQSFFAYVFRPHHVIITLAALCGVLAQNRTGFSWALLIGEVVHFIARGVGYFVEQRIWMNRLEQRQQQEKENSKNQNVNGPSRN